MRAISYSFAVEHIRGGRSQGHHFALAVRARSTLSALIDRPRARGITRSSNSIAVFLHTRRQRQGSEFTRSRKIG
jgi:hypothetical protein